MSLMFDEIQIGDIALHYDKMVEVIGKNEEYIIITKEDGWVVDASDTIEYNIDKTFIGKKAYALLQKDKKIWSLTNIIRKPMEVVFEL